MPVKPKSQEKGGPCCPTAALVACANSRMIPTHWSLRLRRISSDPIALRYPRFSKSQKPSVRTYWRAVGPAVQIGWACAWRVRLKIRCLCRSYGPNKQRPFREIVVRLAIAARVPAPAENTSTKGEHPNADENNESAENDGPLD